MNLIKGKQIQDNSITQSNMFIETESVINNTDVTNKGYVIQIVNEKSGRIHQSRLNQHMTANNATVGQKACDSAIIEFPTSTILVKINGIIVDIGEGLDCYFSPDGVVIRSGGNGQKGDYLYWNSSKYNLSTDDEVDFNYLVAYDYYILNSGETIILNPIYNNLVVKYTGDSGTTMSVVIDGVTFIVGNVGGNFVWDIGGLDEHTFTTTNESIIVIINGQNYTIWFDGFGSLIFSVKKGGEFLNLNSFKLEINTTSVNQSITIPHLSGYTYNYIIDYGDGNIKTVSSYNDPNATNVYSTPGTYTIEISGVCETIYINDTGTLRSTIKNIIQWGNTNFKILNFHGCYNLISIPENNSHGLSELTNFVNMFMNCSKLVNIPNDLFSYNTGVTSDGFKSTFRGCLSLSSIPTDLFRYNTLVSSYGFNSTFYGCTGLTSIPTDLFRYNILVSNRGFQSTFFGCTSLTSIPDDLFKYNTLVSDYGFAYTFYNCRSISSIPIDLFRYNTLVSNNGFDSTFYGCTGLTSIPTDLFRYNVNLTTSAFINTFGGCTSLSTIPTNLFSYNTGITSDSFNGTFSNCTSLTSIPSGLFDNNILVSNSAFRSTFSNCTGITSIPTDLFRYNTLVASYGFTSTFNNTRITSIPNDLFKYNINVTNNGFANTFSNCITLTTIPTDLFRYNINVTNNAFFETFRGCTSLTTIPSDIFRYNTLVSSHAFNQTFYGCSSLTTIPEYTFRYNTNVGYYGFYNTFYGCIKLQLNPWIFYANGEQSTRFSGSTDLYFNGCFYRTTFTGTQGIAPDLWNCTFGSTPSRTSCFGGSGNSLTSISNYTSIPSTWK